MRPENVVLELKSFFKRARAELEESKKFGPPSDKINELKDTVTGKFKDAVRNMNPIIKNPCLRVSANHPESKDSSNSCVEALNVLPLDSGDVDYIL